MPQSAPHVFRGAMPRAPASDLEELSLFNDEEEEQGPVGAVASIQAAARKGTRPRVVKFAFATSTRHTENRARRTWGKATRHTRAIPLGRTRRAAGRRATRRGLCPRASAS